MSSEKGEECSRQQNRPPLSERHRALFFRHGAKTKLPSDMITSTQKCHPSHHIMRRSTMMAVHEQRQGTVACLMHILVLLWCFHWITEVGAFILPKNAPKHSVHLSATSKGSRQPKKRRQKSELDSLVAGKYIR